MDFHRESEPAMQRNRLSVGMARINLPISKRKQFEVIGFQNKDASCH